MKKHKKRAQLWLKRLRGINLNNCAIYSYAIKAILEEVQERGFTLKDIGTSKKELNGLRVKGCKMVASLKEKFEKERKSST